MTDAAPLLGRAPPRGRLALAVDQCRAVTERHARTFSFAAHLLPAGLRAACYAVYAFCRRADDAVDAAPDPERARAALAAARERLRHAFSAGGLDDADGEVAALAWAARAFGVEEAPLIELLEGMALDLAPLRLRTFPALLRYCQLAAGTVGRALAPALGASGEALAAAESLGVAMQLTNILRDVDEDAGRGRVYLAADELEAAGLSQEELLAAHLTRRAPPRLPPFVALQIERARCFYAAAEPGLAAIPSFRARLCVRAMGVIYGEILVALERQRRDPYAGRARVSTPRKLWLLLGCLFGRRLPQPRSPAARVPAAALLRHAQASE